MGDALKEIKQLTEDKRQLIEDMDAHTRRFERDIDFVIEERDAARNSLDDRYGILEKALVELVVTKKTVHDLQVGIDSVVEETSRDLYNRFRSRLRDKEIAEFEVNPNGEELVNMKAEHSKILKELAVVCHQQMFGKDPES